MNDVLFRGHGGDVYIWRPVLGVTGGGPACAGMAVYHDEVEIEDFEYDEDTDTYYYPCPCGDRFAITKVQYDARTLLYGPGCHRVLGLFVRVM